MGILGSAVDKVKNEVFYLSVKGTLARHMANTGYVSEDNAFTLIENGLKLTGPIPLFNKPPVGFNPKTHTVVTATTTGQFSNIINAVQTWFQNDFGPDLQLLAQELPEILQIISIFAAL